MIDPIKGLRKVGSGDDRTERGFTLVEPGRNFGDKGKESGDGRVAMKESMLERSTRKRRAKEREKQALKDF